MKFLEEQDIACLKAGYSFDGEKEAFVCPVCGESFDAEEIFCVEGRYLTARRAAARHCENRHGGPLAALLESGIPYGDFFRHAPAMNPNRAFITGKVCGVRVEEIQDPLMRDIRYLDKLVDELAKGKPMEQILRK